MIVILQLVLTGVLVLPFTLMEQGLPPSNYTVVGAFPWLMSDAGGPSTWWPLLAWAGSPLVQKKEAEETRKQHLPNDTCFRSCLQVLPG